MTRMLHPEESEAPIRQVLVVSHDYGSRTICARMLSQAGFAVSEAENGQAAWSALLAGSCELVITDDFMPGCTGLELAEQMRSDGMTTPVILISGAAESPGRIVSSGAQMVVFLAKPFSFYELLIRVNAALDSFPTTAQRRTGARRQESVVGRGARQLGR